MARMRPTILVVDDFYADPMAVRSFALRQQYYCPYQPDREVHSGRAAVKWVASWFKEFDQCPFKSSRSLIERLSHLTGDEVDLHHWRLSFPTTPEGKADPACDVHAHSCLWNCCFHLKPETDQKLGEGVHNHVTDAWNSVGPDGWTGLVYLSLDPPVRGGLKLWRNRDPRKNLDWMTPKQNWELIDDLGNVFNRLILVRGDVPHSGAAGWGDSLRNGRLYQTFFFRVKRSRPTSGLRVRLP
jgi:hypothetical protein